MTEQISIGPVTISGSAHLFDGSKFGYNSGSKRNIASGNITFQKGQFTDSEAFKFICGFDQALQIKGLLEIGEPVWVDTSASLTDNDYFQHKGWYMLNTMDTDMLSPALVEVTLDVSKISSNANEYLTMDYSRGVYDGLALDYTYTPTTVTTLFSDSFTSIDYGLWDTIKRGWWYGVQGTPTASMASDGNELDMTSRGYSGTNYSSAWTRTLQKFYPPFTVETVLDRNTLPAAGNASIALGLSKEVMQEGNQGLWKNGSIEWFYAQWAINTASTNLELAISNCGAWRQHYPWTSQGTVNEELKIRLTMDAAANIIVVVANGTGGVFGAEREIYRGPSGFSNPSWGFYFYPYIARNYNTDWTGSFQYLTVTKETAASVPYVATLPYAATGTPTATGNRAGEDGNIPYYDSPTTELRFLKPTDLYKGGVKLFSTNNGASTSRQVYHTDAVLTPTTTVLKNEFTRLTFGANGFTIAGYDSGGWQDINAIVTGAITLIKPLLINHDKVVLQVNDTKIIMYRSSPMITIRHPNTALTYNIKDRYFYGGALDSTIAPGDVIDMSALTNGYYAYTYNNAADTYRLIVGKKDPTTIFADSIPAADYTGLGWYVKTATGVDLPESLVKQWWKQTHTGISIKQVV